MPLPWYGTIILITPDFMLLNFGLSNHGWEDDCHMYIIRYSDWIIYQCHFLIRYRFKYHARYFLSQINGLIILTDFLCFLNNQATVRSCQLPWMRINGEFSHLIAMRTCFQNLPLTDEEIQNWIGRGRVLKKIGYRVPVGPCLWVG